ncbi:kinase-like protein, partial [Auricularia subglabra TFB-10046 SS5]
IVSLYMSNGNLTEYLKTHKGCDKKKLIMQVAEAVNFLHTARNLVHGDIKCDNVLISDFGDALLADFGLSTFIEKDESATGTMTAICNMNTLRFAAPELLAGSEDSSGVPRSKTPESDVYAFGMLILEV